MKTKAVLVLPILLLAVLLASCGPAGEASPAASPTRSAAETDQPAAELPSTATEAAPAPISGPTATAAEVSESIRRFAGEPELALVEGVARATAFGASRDYTAVLSTGDAVRFDVDVRTGEVTGFLRLNQTSGAVVVGLDQARDAALAFARAHYAGFDESVLRPERAELVDPGADSPKYYALWWVQVDPISGAYLPNEVQVRVNAESGQIDSYSSLRVDLTVSTQPQIDREAAVDLALQAVQGLEGASVVSATLAVSTLPVYEPNGRQALLWRVVVSGTPDATGYTPGASVFVDAQSGEIVHIEPFA